MQKYGKELVEELKRQIERERASIARRIEHIEACDFDWDDCFVSQRVDERGLQLAQDKIALIEQDGGFAWFVEYATLDGQLIEARWCKTQYGTSLRAELPDGRVVWTTAHTAKGLAKKGIKKVMCKRPAWFCFKSAGSGLWGAYAGNYVLFPSDYNFATGEEASVEPVEIKDCDE